MDKYKHSWKTRRGIPLGAYLIFAWCEGFALLMMAIAIWIVFHFRFSLVDVWSQDGTLVGHVPWIVVAVFIFAVASGVRRFTRWRRAMFYKAGGWES